MPASSKESLRFYTPQGDAGPGVLVIHSWWGATAGFVSFCEALASEGFVAGLADLYCGRTASSPQEARRLRGSPRREPMYRTLIRSIEAVQSFEGAGGDIGVVGFSMGGHWAVWLSQRRELPIGATVLYYAARAGSFAASHSSFLAHYADRDPWVSRAARRRMEREIERAGCAYRAFDYPGTQHWFAEDDRVQEYEAEASGLAFERTVKHLKDRLGPT